MTAFSDLLDLIGFEEDDVISLCRKWPDGRDGLQSVFTPVSMAPDLADQLDHVDAWYSVCPIRGDIREFLAAEIAAGRRKPNSRGTGDDVVGLRHLWLDIDYKPNGVREPASAKFLVNRLAEIMGTQPAAWVNSGHGCHVYWRLDHEPGVTYWSPGDVEAIANARAILDRWKAMVNQTAEQLGMRLDPVSDLARILRVPGTRNTKDDTR